MGHGQKYPKAVRSATVTLPPAKGKSFQWKRLYRPLKHRSEDEVLVFLVAHEAFHYLRKTRQVAGWHSEIEADAFALKMLEQYLDVP
jgi:hypothetical protein